MGDEECTPGRRYAFAYLGVGELDGVAAEIRTRYSFPLCDEPEGRSAAYGVAYGNVSHVDVGRFLWAQSGFGRERDAGGTRIKTYRYAEVNGEDYHVEYDTSGAPAEGTRHVYACRLDAAEGTWAFFFDDEEWQTFTDGAWRDRSGNSVQWTGEIYNEQDHMPGTHEHRCEFRSCRRSRAGRGWEGAGIGPEDVRSDDPEKWGAAWRTSTAIEIWDKRD